VACTRLAEKGKVARQVRRFETIIAEIGTDMSPFRPPGIFVSWAGLAPRLVRALLFSSRQSA
jgi:hypothetical protein